MMMITKYISSAFEEGLKKLKVLVIGKNGVETAYESAPFGMDGQVPKGWRAVFGKTDRKGNKVILGFINLNRLNDLDPGSSRIFSTSEDGTALSIDIILRNDGTMEIAGNTDFAVRYNELETAFNQLRSDHNDLVTTVNSIINTFTAWAPVPTDGGAALKALTAALMAASPSTADITPAKVPEVKIKGS